MSLKFSCGPLVEMGGVVVEALPGVFSRGLISRIFGGGI